MADEPKLEMIMARTPESNYQKLALYACRGAGKGCVDNTQKWRKTKKPCADCFGPCPPFWSVQQVLDKINKGDA